MISELRARIYKYALALSVLVTLTVSVPLVAIGVYYKYDLVTSIGAGLLASMGFAIIYAILGNRQLLELIRQTVYEASASETTRLLKEVAEQKEKFSPDKVYLSRFLHQDQFNADLTEDLSKTSFFYFRGTSGKYVPIRLAQCSKTLKQVRLLLVDPDHLFSVRYRVLDKANQGQLSETELECAIAALQDEIKMSLVALFDTRRDIEITVGLEKSTASYRTEILENSMYISVYHTESLRRSNYPDSARFSKFSALYAAHFVDFDRQIKMCERKITFDSLSTERQLLEFMRMDSEEGAAERISNFRASFEEFKDKVLFAD